MAEMRREKLLRFVLRVAVGLIVLLLVLVLWARFGCFATPPELAGRPAVLDVKLTHDADGTRHLGASWFRHRPGRSLLHVEGSPFTMGFSNAALTAELLEFQERSLLDAAHQHLPSPIKFAGMALLVAINNRSLSDYVSHDLQLEILGLSRGSADPFPEYGPRYNRILNYHAAHDIAHWVADRPAIGCTAFAAAGGRTRDGHLIVARTFDFEAGSHFDTNKIIGRYVPEVGHAFLSVAWPGMAGVVTGMNSERVWCSLNGAHSEHRGHIGTPVSLVIRDVLQNATNLDQAVDIIRNAKVFVADSYLIADGKSGQAVVVEKTPATCAVRPMNNDLILQANHFESQELSGDAGNVEYMMAGTSMERMRRLAELVGAANRRIDPRVAVGILRDRCGVNGTELALGNRAAIDALIAAHAVVADVTAGVMWVSRGPHCVGVFDAYSLADFERPAGQEIAEDQLLARVDYENLCKARALTTAAQKEMESEGRLSLPVRTGLREAIRLVPCDSPALALEASALELDGDLTAALAMWRAALAGRPAFRADRLCIEAAIRRLDEKDF